MTGDLVKAMRAAPQPIVAAIDGICAGAGAILAMASDLRFGTARSKVAFLFVRVGLGRLRYGRVRDASAHRRARARRGTALHRPRDAGRAGARSGDSTTSLCEPERRARTRASGRARIAHGPTRGACDDQTHAARRVGDAAGRSRSMRRRARRRACMESADFRRAYEAFVDKTPPAFEGELMDDTRLAVFR